MSAFAVMWIASIVGAMLFYLVGFLTANTRGAIVATRAHSDVGITAFDNHVFGDTSLADSRAAEIEQLEAELSRVSTTLEASRREAEVSVRVHEQAQKDLMARLADAAVIKERLAQAEERSKRLTEMKDERERFFAKAQGNLKASTEQQIKVLSDERKDLKIQLGVLGERVAEVEELRQEKCGLLARAKEAEGLRADVQRLELELGSMRSQHLAHPEEAPTVVGCLPLLPEPGAESGGGTAGALHRLLSGLAGTEGMRCVAIADDLGLPIAGIGEHANNLSAFAGFVGGIANKSREFLPMSGPRRIVVEDTHGSTVSANPFKWRDSHISLVTLSVGPGPSREQVNKLLGQVSNAIG